MKQPNQATQQQNLITSPEAAADSKQSPNESNGNPEECQIEQAADTQQTE